MLVCGSVRRGRVCCAVFIVFILARSIKIYVENIAEPVWIIRQGHQYLYHGQRRRRYASHDRNASEN